MPNGAVSVSPSSTTTSSAGSPSSWATICAQVVSCPWPCDLVPVRRIALPVICTLRSAESNILMPRMSYSRLFPAPSGKAILRTGTKSQGQGHETTWAQIVAHELGLPAEDVVVEEGDTDTAPFGMGTYASRSTPVAGAAVAMVSRKIRAKARKLAAHLLEVSEEDVEWELGRFYVR